MNTENRLICFDNTLQIEAYFLQGIIQKFPLHFHEEYVIGFIENGRRHLVCKGETYDVQPGDLLIFNPHDTHACGPVDEEPLDWRCLNIRTEVMRRAVREVTGADALPVFRQNVLLQCDLAPLLRELHGMVAGGETDFQKEETFFLLMEQLIGRYAELRFSAAPASGREEVEAACAYLEQHYAEAITLDELSRVAGLSKYHLLRVFTRQKGISPYRYLETVRIDQAKKLLEQGVPPAEAAARTGFSDQSHFTNFFKTMIGLTPRQYGAIFTGDPPETEETGI